MFHWTEVGFCYRPSRLARLHQYYPIECRSAWACTEGRRLDEWLPFHVGSCLPDLRMSHHICSPTNTYPSNPNPLFCSKMSLTWCILSLLLHYDPVGCSVYQNPSWSPLRTKAEAEAILCKQSHPTQCGLMLTKNQSTTEVKGAARPLLIHQRPSALPHTSFSSKWFVSLELKESASKHLAEWLTSYW